MAQWKGDAAYFDFTPPDGAEPVKARIWAYSDPKPAFEPIRGYYAFYPSSESAGGKWHGEVEGERVEAEEGDVSGRRSCCYGLGWTLILSLCLQFYGGWKTDEIVGDPKGGPGPQRS